MKMMKRNNGQLLSIKKSTGPEKRPNTAISNPHSLLGDAEDCFLSVYAVKSCIAHGEKLCRIHVRQVGCQEVVPRVGGGKIYCGSRIDFVIKLESLFFIPFPNADYMSRILLLP